MVDQICTSVDSGAYAPGPRTILKNGEVAVNDSHFHRNGMLHGGGTLQLRLNLNNNVLGQISLAQLRVFEEYLLSYARAPTTYRQVRNDPAWQGMYNYEVRAITYIDRGGDLETRMELSVPCRECGVVLPAKLVTVDHQNARSGNALDPVFKFFRAMGYTDQSPTGLKGRSLLEDVGNRAGGTPGNGGNYALNPVGVIVFSLFRGSGYNQNLLNLSMHSFVNLRPVCSFCNPSLGAH